MATNVGVRDLKMEAPRLVERASRGERIVITRYGRPRAQLGPIEDSPPEAAAHSGRAAEWERERAAFERMAHGQARRYRGRYVAVKGGRVIDHGIDHEALFQRVWKRLDGATFFIGRVGAPPPVVDMPGFEVGE